jgi:hypothetical protein
VKGCIGFGLSEVLVLIQSSTFSISQERRHSRGLSFTFTVFYSQRRGLLVCPTLFVITYQLDFKVFRPRTLSSISKNR